jgi:hypothetical protein
MFESVANSTTLADFSTSLICSPVGVTVNCSGSGTATQFCLTPTAQNYCFVLQVNGYNSPVVCGWALASIQKPISISCIRSTICEPTMCDIHALNNSTHINPYSPQKPDGSTPDSFSEWFGYAHNASGGFNIQNPNACTVARGSTYCIRGSATMNQQPFNTCVQLSVTGLASVCKNMTVNTNSGYIELCGSLTTNNNYFPTSTPITVSVSCWNGASYTLVNSCSQNLCLLGLPFSAIASCVCIASGQPTKLCSNVTICNLSGANNSFCVTLQNSTKGSGVYTVANVSVTNGSSCTVNALTTTSVTNAVGDTISMCINSYGTSTTLYPYVCGDGGQLNFYASA